MAVRILTKPPKETTNKTQSNEISVKKCDVVLGLDVPLAFSEAAQKNPALHRQTLKTFWGKTFFFKLINLFFNSFYLKDVILQEGVIAVLCSVAEHPSVYSFIIRV